MSVIIIENTIFFVMMKLPRFIPIVTPESMNIFNRLAEHFEYAILPYYTLLSTDTLGLRLRQDTKWILSSIMPDKLLLEKDTHHYFGDRARELGIEYVLVWDMPTYLNDVEKSLENTYVSLEKIEYFIKKGFIVIPLIKGAYEEHIRVSASHISELGFKIAAFHVSEYLSAVEKPWPQINDYSLTAEDLMTRYIEVILEYDFRQVLLVGGGSPRHASRLLELDNRICVAGYSWYLDGQRNNIYMPTGYIKPLGNKYFECNCPNCGSIPPKTLKTSSYIAGHNLYLNKHLVDGLDEGVEISFYDAIADYHEDILVVGEVSVGAEKSMWRRLLNYLDRVKPDYLIIIGSIFNWEIIDERHIKEWIEFARRLKSLYLDYGTELIPVYRYVGKNIPYLMSSLSYTVNMRPRRSIFGESELDPVLGIITRIITSSRAPIKVKKRVEPGRDIVFTIEYHGVAEKPLEAAAEELKHLKKGGDWLITNYLNQPYIDWENRVATPGVWDLTWRHYTQPKPGALHITRNGEINLIKPSE